MSQIAVDSALVKIEYRVCGPLFNDPVIYWTRHMADVMRAKADEIRPSHEGPHWLETRRVITEKWKRDGQ